MSTKTLCTMVWGNYWEQYGDAFIERASKLNTTPDQFLIVSDREINVPSHYDVVIADTNGMWTINKFRQAMLDNATSDWICTADLDDVIYPNYIDNLSDDHDVHNILPEKIDHPATFWGWGGQEMYDRSIELCSQGYAFDFFSAHHLSPATFIKSKFIRDNNIRVPEIGWDDVGLALRLRYNNASVYWDDTPRYSYTINHNGVSSPANIELVKIRSDITISYAKSLLKDKK